MKYIIVDEVGIEVPIIFSELQKHSNVAGMKKVISAGFCYFRSDTVLGNDSNGSEDQDVLAVSCWGESVSLRLKSRGKVDEEIILKHNEFRC